MTSDDEDIPTLLRQVADRIEKRDARIKVLLERLSARHVFVAVTVEEPDEKSVP